MTTMRPYRDTVVVRLDDLARDRRTAGGLVVPDGVLTSRRIAAVTGTVVSTGPGRTVDRCPVHAGHWVDTGVAPGDRVVVDSIDVGQRVYDEDGAELRAIRADEILAVLDP